MQPIKVPARADALWRNASWRYDRLKECIERHRLTTDDLCDLTGAAPTSVSMWLRPYGGSIGASTLYGLILTLNNRVPS